MPAQAILEYAKRIQALAQIGLTYSPNPFDIERYRELKEISFHLMEEATTTPLDKLALYFSDRKEYVTPKVDVRAVVFNTQQEILLVREASDGHWSLPGGWADIGYSPREVAIKEVLEETGLTVVPTRLLAVLDKRMHAHPPALEYTYKLFIQCAMTGGALSGTFDILEAAFWGPKALPSLSLERVTPEQLDLMFEYARDPAREVTLD